VNDAAAHAPVAAAVAPVAPPQGGSPNAANANAPTMQQIATAAESNPQLAALLQQMLASNANAQAPVSPLAAALANVPQFEQIRQLTQSNPQLLQGIIGQLRTQNPELFNLINGNPAEFIQLLQDGLPAGATGGMPAMPGAGGAGAGAAGRPGVIQITPQEKEAIDRLAALGFPQQVAAEAYIVCGKNEELAANYLFENGMDGMDFEGGGGN